MLRLYQFTALLMVIAALMVFNLPYDLNIPANLLREAYRFLTTPRLSSLTRFLS